MEQTILIVEDDNNDRWFGALGFEFIGLGRNLRFATDGQEALDYLHGLGKYIDRSRFPLPQLILLDMKLPKVSGLEVLKWLRSQPQFQSTIVIPLTSSGLQEDILAAHAAGASDYQIKPLQLSQWRALAQYIQSTWLPESARSVPAEVLTRSASSSARKKETW